MSERLPVPAPSGALPSVAILAPPPRDAPPLSELFAFMRDAERRFGTLRMRIVDRTWTARGDEVETIEVWLRHPGHAKVLSRFREEPVRGESHTWVSDGRAVHTYDARSRSVSTRPVRPRPTGIVDPALPSFGRVYVPLTALPMESLPDTFVHPHGFCRNVLVTAETRILGTTRLSGEREAWLLRADHPRTTEVLTDRPDHWVEVGVDRLSGIILLLVEHIGDRITRHAEVTDLELDPPLLEDVFISHVPASATRLY